MRRDKTINIPAKQPSSHQQSPRKGSRTGPFIAILVYQADGLVLEHQFFHRFVLRKEKGRPQWAAPDFSKLFHPLGLGVYRFKAAWKRLPEDTGIKKPP